MNLIRYKNRKVYSPEVKGYVNFNYIKALVQEGRVFTIRDHVTRNDVTAQVLTEMVATKMRANLLDVNTLRGML
jgi:polyhydroxyalkanoate synthesis regulator protein